MRRPWLKFSFLVFLLASIVFIGSKHIVWASSEAAPLGQTVPTRVKTNTSTPVVPAHPTSTKTLGFSTIGHQTATYTLVPSETQSSTAIVAITTLTATRLSTKTTMPTITSVLPTATPKTDGKSVNGKNPWILPIGGVILVILGVFVFVLRRDQSH